MLIRLLLPLFMLPFIVLGVDPLHPSQSHHASKTPEELKFTYNPNDPLPTEQVRAISNPLARCRASKPDDRRQIKRKFGDGEVRWVPTQETNRQYVVRRMGKWQVYAKERRKQEGERRREVQAETGTRQLSKKALQMRSKKEFARQGDPNEMMPHSINQPGPDGPITKGEWLAKIKHQNRVRVARFHERRREQNQMQPSTKRRKAFDLNLPPLPED